MGWVENGKEGRSTKGKEEWGETCKDKCVVFCSKFQCDRYILSPLWGENLRYDCYFHKILKFGSNSALNDGNNTADKYYALATLPSRIDPLPTVLICSQLVMQLLASCSPYARCANELGHLALAATISFLLQLRVHVH